MKHLHLLTILLCTLSCKQQKTETTAEPLVGPTTQTITTDTYELTFTEQQDGLLVLFPCFPCDAANTKAEFNIVDIASKNNVAVLLMNFNLHLWLSDTEKKELAQVLLTAITEYNINTENTFIGGFSGGGNVSLLLTDYLLATGASLQPKGVFIADSPIDLLGLYENAQKTIQKNVSDVAVQEANWIVETFETEFGVGINDKTILNYENKSPYTLKTHTTQNLKHLKDLKIRFYSEPDTLWWEKNRQVAYEETNSYYIAQLTRDLNTLHGANTATYIKTENKGYRANGDRHPHSWSIIDGQDLIDWMLTK